MRKLVFSMGAIAIDFMVAFAWSHTRLPKEAPQRQSIRYDKGSLPEQWGAI